MTRPEQPGGGPLMAATPDLPARGGMEQEAMPCPTYPRLANSQTALIIHPPRPLRSVSRGVVRRDGVRCPRVSFATRHSAAPELRPGPLRGPARSWLTTVGSTPNAIRPSLNKERGAKTKRRGGPAGHLRRKRGPAPLKSPRLARREAPACRKARALGLRFSARHPPQTPDAPASRQGERMSGRNAATNSIAPLDGEGGASQRAGWGETSLMRYRFAA